MFKIHYSNFIVSLPPLTVPSQKSGGTRPIALDIIRRWNLNNKVELYVDVHANMTLNLSV